MGKQAQAGAGAIYRYYRGELRQLFSRITIPNSICFSPDGRLVYFADTPKQEIYSQPLDEKGWPVGDRNVFIDLKSKGLYPDGSVTDAEGGLWNAQWGSGSVAHYNSSGEFIDRVYVGGAHSSCPAFGGDKFDQLFVTTALEGIEQPSAQDGAVYVVQLNVQGKPEPGVLL
ncbi:MAG: SMP-30/gluconolactonase/LRE family protein [Alphaproteobacteria bacterium]